MLVFLLLLLFVWSQVDLALILLDWVAANLGLIPKAVVEELGAVAHLGFILKAVVDEFGAAAHFGLIPKADMGVLGADHLGLIPKVSRVRHRHHDNHRQHRYVGVVDHKWGQKVIIT
jgi:hypothetical protein